MLVNSFSAQLESLFKAVKSVNKTQATINMPFTVDGKEYTIYVSYDAFFKKFSIDIAVGVVKIFDCYNRTLTLHTDEKHEFIIMFITWYLSSEFCRKQKS